MKHIKVNITKMVNYLGLLTNPQIKYKALLEVMRDYRKGGITPDNFNQVALIFESISLFGQSSLHDYALSRFHLTNLSEDDIQFITERALKKATELHKKCWHPDASASTCSLDANNHIKISEAHSIQNNGILREISEDGNVMMRKAKKGKSVATLLHKNHASTFYGFCNAHDSIFDPIEKKKYSGTIEQHFLFAYRSCIATIHNKIEVSLIMDYGNQPVNDIERNLEIFNNAILTSDFDILDTVVIELPEPYPFAASSSFYLDFDFTGRDIIHSEERMENIFITFFPKDDKSFFILSYFKIDSRLYSGIARQIKSRNNLYSDISILIAAHAENVYFKPSYYTPFIEGQHDSIRKVLAETQYDFSGVNPYTGEDFEMSMTSNNYLQNIHQINFFK